MSTFRSTATLWIASANTGGIYLRIPECHFEEMFQAGLVAHEYLSEGRVHAAGYWPIHHATSTPRDLEGHKVWKVMGHIGRPEKVVYKAFPADFGPESIFCEIRDSRDRHVDPIGAGPGCARVVTESPFADSQPGFPWGFAGIVFTLGSAALTWWLSSVKENPHPPPPPVPPVQAMPPQPQAQVPPPAQAETAADTARRFRTGMDLIRRRRARQPTGLVGPFHQADEECFSCYESYDDGYHAKWTFSCGHVICQECLYDLHEVHLNGGQFRCPMDRNLMTPTECHRVFAA